MVDPLLYNVKMNSTYLLDIIAYKIGVGTFFQNLQAYLYDQCHRGLSPADQEAS
jgi:hypothetical protein